MTIEKRPNATADKNAPTQAPDRAPIIAPGTGPKLPGPPGVPGTERFRLLAYVKQESMVRVDKRPDETVLTWPHLLRAEFLMAMLITGCSWSRQRLHPARRSRRWRTRRSRRTSPRRRGTSSGLQEILSYFNADGRRRARHPGLPRRADPDPVRRPHLRTRPRATAS